MYGSYNIPFEIDKEGIYISIKKEGNIHIYRREYLDEVMEKVIVKGDGKVLINPIEPLNRPKKITSHLLIECSRTLNIAPGEKVKVHIKFPVEIGVFISSRSDMEVLDILTLARKKFTLYGDSSTGLICKYWRSEVYSSIPEIDPMLEGIMELEISNETNRWAEVSKSVFNAYGMKIYHKPDLVSMKARMRITSHGIAETEFIDSPVIYGMQKSTELYVARKVYVNGTKYIMETGI